MWPPENPSIVYKVYAFIFLVLFYVCFPLTFLFHLMSLTSVMQILINLLSSLTIWGCLLKGLNIAVKKRKIVEALELMQGLDDALKTKEEKIAAKNMINLSRRIFLYFTALYLVTVSVTGVAAPLQQGNSRDRTSDSEAETRDCFALICTSMIWSLYSFSDAEPTLLYPTWYPYDWRHGRAYWMTYTYQFIGSIVLSELTATLDTYGVVLMIIMGGQLDNLGVSLADLGKANRKDKRALRVAVYREMVDCTKRHIKLIE